MRRIFLRVDLQVIRRNDEVRSATPQARRALQGMAFFQQPRSGGSRLVEILIAIFILGLVMATVYASYSGILTTSHTMEEELDIYKMARAAMDRMIKIYLPCRRLPVPRAPPVLLTCAPRKKVK